MECVICPSQWTNDTYVYAGRQTSSDNYYIYSCISLFHVIYIYSLYTYNVRYMIQIWWNYFFLMSFLSKKLTMPSFSSCNQKWRGSYLFCVLCNQEYEITWKPVCYCIADIYVAVLMLLSDYGTRTKKRSITGLFLNTIEVVFIILMKINFHYSYMIWYYVTAVVWNCHSLVTV